MVEESTTSKFFEARIVGTTARIKEINAQMNALRTERDELNETREDLRAELLEALGRELKVKQSDSDRKAGR